jgi:very-short-patch-repair endonuclease
MLSAKAVPQPIVAKSSLQIADFACIEARLIMEMGGGQHAESVAPFPDSTVRVKVRRSCGSGTTMLLHNRTGAS